MINRYSTTRRRFARKAAQGLSAVLLAGLGLAGCKTEIEAVPDLSQDYYPLEVGSYRIYDVADTTYTDGRPTVSRFQFREQIESEAVTDVTGQPAYQVIRSRRATAADAWKVDSVLLVSATPRRVLLLRNNRQTVELVFPVQEGRAWSMNAFNTVDSVNAETRRYERVGQSLSVKNGTRQLTFENTISTTADDVNLYYATVRHETYAKGLGLVYRVRRRFTYCDNSPTCVPSPAYIYRGQSRWEVLVDSGK
jgi:hypothetical protein